MIRSSALVRSARRATRHARIRARVRGTAARPRLSVFRSKKHLFVQLIDDDAARTLLTVHDHMLPKGAPANISPPAALRAAIQTGEVVAGADWSLGVTRAFALGALLAERAKKAKIGSVVFDRGGYTYHGRVKAVADGARAGGLNF